jgi:ATP-dependent helicase/nuclease subunit B
MVAAFFQDAQDFCAPFRGCRFRCTSVTFYEPFGLIERRQQVRANGPIVIDLSSAVCLRPKWCVQVRLLLGAAGSGKTFRCLNEARQALLRSAEGLPLILLAPRQGTYQLEQQLLASPVLAGFTRLFILSFEALARFIFEQIARPCPRQLSEEGRLMVLRSLLAQKRGNLKVFRASARMTGFAQQLNLMLGEVQRARLSPTALRQIAAAVPQSEGLARKLEDLAALLQEYLDWLQAHDLQDSDALLTAAAELLRAQPHSGFRIESLWVDGFAEFSEAELDLLCALIPHCESTTLTFCIDTLPAQKQSWLSHWSIVTRTLSNCRRRLTGVAVVDVITEALPRNSDGSRFVKNPVLKHLEQSWAAPRPYPKMTAPAVAPGKGDGAVADKPASALSKDPDLASDVSCSMRVVTCPNREAEVTLAAREILAFVRAGARFRDVSVLLRKLDPYHQVIQQVFSRYQIPFFLDRRESVSHHPLAELTRSALRVIALDWRREDWFAALKTGLFPARDEEIDLLENEALARGWKGQTWLKQIRLKDIPKTDYERDRLAQLEKQLESARRQILPPFEQFMSALAASRNRPTGPQLASAIRGLWTSLRVEQQLDNLTSGTELDFRSNPGTSVHETVWRQMNAWLDNAELAFPGESLPLREWVPILEAGLANLTIGIIPPALDQVLVGAVDRSRTPEVKLALVLGLNEGVFPASSEQASLLTDTDRLELERRDVFLGSSARRHLGRERYLGYIACTRARQKLVLTSASHDPAGAPLNPSPLLSHVMLLFPGLRPETAPLVASWKEAENPAELFPFLARTDHGKQTLGGKQSEHSALCISNSALLSVPGVASLLENMRCFSNRQVSETLTRQVARRLYGPVLRTSVSRMEQFAACPFKFFVHSGLRAEERRLFELDVKEQGTFQHDVMALFHQELRKEGKRWRDITSAEARKRLGQLAQRLVSSFRDGLFETSDQARFTARVLTESLQDFVETLVGWMRTQYQFDPVEVELPFGEDGASPAWTLPLGVGKQLELYGRIDRVDLYRLPGTNRALCVVVDYKSSQKQLDQVLVTYGLQLQLLTYLNVVRQWPNPGSAFHVDQLEPVGVFYVNLRGKYGRERNRNDALADPEGARKLAYRHSGRFDAKALRQLDGRPDAREGDQFNYRINNDGQINKGCREAVAEENFRSLLTQVQTNLRTMGQQVYDGRAEVSPYRKGILTACDQCTYQAICRIDPWTHKFRVLRRATAATDLENNEDPSAAL